VLLLTVVELVVDKDVMVWLVVLAVVVRTEDLAAELVGLDKVMLVAVLLEILVEAEAAELVEQVHSLVVMLVVLVVRL
tara:strand:+ start:306 stop:539 length:234 start_codon:yes stop_codon:yes gene_type:complete